MIDISFLRNSHLFYVYDCLPACVSVRHMPTVLQRLEEGVGSLDMELQMWAVMWVLVIEPRSSVRSVSALNCWASFLALCKHLYITWEFQIANNIWAIS